MIDHQAEVLAQVRRGDLVESAHRGHLVALDAGGAPVRRGGEPATIVYPRSSLKPVQAVAMLRAGLDLDAELLALACASHSGEPGHLDGVRRILAGVGLAEADLRNTPAPPTDYEAAYAWRAAGHEPASSLTQNCSGKHAAMLATCRAAGWDTAGYLDPAHPLQRAVKDTLEELSGERVGAEGVDGCGAPLLGITLTGLARAFGRLAAAPEGTDEHLVARAMSRYPEWVGGTDRDVTTLMRGVPGSVAKDGAEGVYAIGLADGSAVACKIADGASRARAVVLVAGLAALGVGAPAELAEYPVLGHGRQVGAIRASGALTG